MPVVHTNARTASSVEVGLGRCVKQGQDVLSLTRLAPQGGLAWSQLPPAHGSLALMVLLEAPETNRTVSSKSDCSHSPFPKPESYISIRTDRKVHPLLVSFK